MSAVQGTLSLNRLLPEPLLSSLPSALAGAALSGMTLDSRQVGAGDLFVALEGARVDGRQFISDALAQGAVAALVASARELPELTQDQRERVIEVPELASQLSELAGRFYGDPSRELELLGITGTNGKTTCALLAAQIYAQLQAGEHRAGQAGVIGTLGYGLLQSDGSMAEQMAELTHTGLTTPDAISLQRALRQLSAQSAQYLAMEVSSHSLVQGRLRAVRVPVALFTNLSQDHQDYHSSMAEYGAAKAQLLRQRGLHTAVLNRDDAWAVGLHAHLPEGVKGLTFSVEQSDADVYLTECVEQRSGVSALLQSPWGQGELHSALLGRFNLSNLLGVITACCAQGFALGQVLAAVPALVAAPGRMEAVVVDDQYQDIQLVVDYAHTPDALENTLQALQAHNTGRLWCVFGCGGDRDKDKRPMMGRIAERYSDYVIVTNDNPRTEDPAQITADILKGMDNDHQCLVIADRAHAIDLAVQQARAGDTVLISGKGHEDYQIFAERTVDFSDRDQSAHSLRRRLSKTTNTGVAS